VWISTGRLQVSPRGSLPQALMSPGLKPVDLASFFAGLKAHASTGRRRAFARPPRASAYTQTREKPPWQRAVSTQAVRFRSPKVVSHRRRSELLDHESQRFRAGLTSAAPPALRAGGNAPACTDEGGVPQPGFFSARLALPHKRRTRTHAAGKQRRGTRFARAVSAGLKPRPPEDPRELRTYKPSLDASVRG